MYTFNLFVVAIGILYCDFCSNVRVIPERVAIETVNTTYMDNVKISIRRYDRKSGYFFNFEATIKHTWGNNISTHIVLYQFLNNEYKRSFIEFHFARGCDFVNKDQFLGKILKSSLARAGLICPVKPGYYVLSNMSLLVDNFPYVWPYQRAKAIGTIMCGENFILNGSLYVKFEQMKRN